MLHANSSFLTSARKVSHRKCFGEGLGQLNKNKSNNRLKTSEKSQMKDKYISGHLGILFSSLQPFQEQQFFCKTRTKCTGKLCFFYRFIIMKAALFISQS